VRAGLAQLKVVEAQLQSAEAQVVQNEAELRQAQVDLEHTIIRAPVDGVVVSRTVDVGQTVAASLQAPTLFTIAQDLAKMQVDVSVDEADVGRIRVGLRAAFTVDSFPGRTFIGQVMQIRKAAQVVQNVVTYTVVVSAANPELTLLPGMTANVRIVTDRKEDVLKVANAALRFRPPGVEAERPARSGPGAGRGAAPGEGVPGRVWVVGPDGQPKPLALRLGISDGSFTEVVSGDLADKQEVIVGLAPGQSRPATPPGPRMF
jgi:HlyD family secretion protein